MLKKIYSVFTRDERIIFWTALAAVAVSATALAGFGFITNTHDVPALGGEYTEGVLGEPVYANPVTASTEIDKGLVRLLFANVSQLADKIELSKDGRTWDVRLKENLHWQDGEKLTSDDVIFTIEKIQDPETFLAAFGLLAGSSGGTPERIGISVKFGHPVCFLLRHAEESVCPAETFVRRYAAGKLASLRLQPQTGG